MFKMHALSVLSYYLIGNQFLNSSANVQNKFDYTKKCVNLRREKSQFSCGYRVKKTFTPVSHT